MVHWYPRGGAEARGRKKMLKPPSQATRRKLENSSLQFAFCLDNSGGRGMGLNARMPLQGDRAPRRQSFVDEFAKYSAVVSVRLPLLDPVFKRRQRSTLRPKPEVRPLKKPDLWPGPNIRPEAECPTGDQTSDRRPNVLEGYMVKL